MHRLFFYLLILLIPTQLGLHFWPAWAMVLGRRVDYLSPTLFTTDILIFLTLLSWLISVWPRISVFVFRILGKKQKNFSLTDIRHTIPHILFFIFAGVNIFFSLNKAIAVYYWLKLAEFGLLGYYIVKTKPNASRIAYCLLLSVFYSSIIAIFQFLLQHSVGGPLWLLGERTFSIDTPGIARIVAGGRELLRAYGTFPHPNVLGGYLAITLPFIIIQLSNYPTHLPAPERSDGGQVIKLSNAKKYVYFITIFFGIIALVLTFSRSAWIVASLGIGWIFFRKKRILFFLLVSCFLSLVAFSFHPLDESVVVRNELNFASVKIIQSAPLVGVGLGNFLVGLPRYLPSRTIYFLQPVHNIYLLVLSEIGLIGLIGLIWLIRKRIKINVALITILLLGLVDHYPVTLQQGRLLLTLFIALSYRGLH